MSFCDNNNDRSLCGANDGGKEDDSDYNGYNGHVGASISFINNDERPQVLQQQPQQQPQDRQYNHRATRLPSKRPNSFPASVNESRRIRSRKPTDSRRSSYTSTSSADADTAMSTQGIETDATVASASSSSDPRLLSLLSGDGVAVDVNSRSSAYMRGAESSRVSGRASRSGGDGRSSRVVTKGDPAVVVMKTTPSEVVVDDTLLAKELNELDFEERTKVFEEVHGVVRDHANPERDDPQFVEQKLLEMRQQLQSMPKAHRRAWDKAVFYRPKLATDKSFHIMFLRADRYDAALAAKRCAKYFTHKLELFGEEKLVQDITLQDLNEDDMECARNGSFCILPLRDTAGRSVWFVSLGRFRYKHWKNHIRYCWYQVMTTLEREEAQIHGVVDVVYCVGMNSTETSFAEMLTCGGPMVNNLPFRMTGMHFCYSDEKLKPAMSLIQLVVGRQTRLRFRTHFGSHVEVQYALMTFGIPISVVPLEERTGNYLSHLNEQYLKQREETEERRRRVQRERRAEEQRLLKEQQEEQRKKDQKKKQEKKSSSTVSASASTPSAKKKEKKTIFKPSIVVDSPLENDVLLGRGRPFQDYVGNQQLGRMIDQQRQRYLSAKDRFDKTYISMQIVEEIQKLGGRFLQRSPDKGGWELVSDAVARDKVSHSFRSGHSRNSSTTISSISSVSSNNNDDEDD